MSTSLDTLYTETSTQSNQYSTNFYMIKNFADNNKKRSLFLFIDDYMKVRAKAKIAEDTSDLNTEVDENLMESKKRKRIQKVLSSSEDSINESLLSPPPKIQRFKKKSK